MDESEIVTAQPHRPLRIPIVMVRDEFLFLQRRVQPWITLVLAENHKQLLDLIHSGTPPPAVVVDENLAKNYWRDVLADESRSNGALIILLTGDQTGDTWTDAMLSGAFDVLTRPVSAQQLTRSIEVADRRWQQMRPT